MIIYSKINKAEEFLNYGGKAYRLAVMQEQGFPIPEFLCLNELTSDEEILLAVKSYFSSDVPLFSVRSSADIEDSQVASFAGQFDTYLNVKLEEIPLAVRKCFASNNARNLKTYMELTEKKDISMNVIIQRMIKSDYSGVMFTCNPLGILSETVLIVGEGEGCNVVSDKINTTSYYHNRIDGKEYCVKQKDSPDLSIEKRQELYNLGKRAETFFGKGLDIEYTIAGDKCYLLQARPITTISKSDQITIIDNSNIVESYPGITLPLTDSFVKTVYTEIFVDLVNRVSGSNKITIQNPEIFSSMVESWNGRMFYNINHWYFVLKLLPFSNRIIPIWQEMLGVNEDMPLPQFSKTSFLVKLRITINFIALLFTTPKKMEQLRDDFMVAENYFNDHFKDNLPYEELFGLYEYLRTEILKKWDITLANDMYSFLMTAAYKKVLLKKGYQKNECNAKISGIQNVESTKPIKSILELAIIYRDYGETLEYREKFSEYIEKFGDRSIGELKLETETFRERQDLLTEQIKNFAKMKDLDNQFKKIGSNNSDVTNFFGKKALLGISNREFSRMNRSRLFGFARKLFLAMGEQLAEQGKIQNKRDVFYLTTDELKNGLNVTDFKSIISERKQLYESYEKLPEYQKAVFSGKIVNKPICVVNQIDDIKNNNIIIGIPCSSGKVIGTVVVIDDVDNTINTNGKIIVTHSTDPGWVFLIACAKGIIAEKGSLLSHTAIISRELQIPSIVGADNATKILKTGDKVEMDCNTGIIKKIS